MNKKSFLCRSTAIKLTIVVAVVIFCGFGKANSMVFCAVKRNPGISQSLFHKNVESAFGTLQLDRELRDAYSVILLGFSPKFGLVFYRKM